MGTSIKNIGATALALFSLTATYWLGERTLWADSVPTAEPIVPLPREAPELDMSKVALGRRLFEDKRFSHQNRVACASCHDLQRGGMDGLAQSVGEGGAKGEINAPTVFNVAFNFRFFWNGRAATLEDQIDGPLRDTRELNSNWEEVITKLVESGEYRESFRQLYGDQITEGTLKDAIATFERSLVTPNSKFDRYLRGDVLALTSNEKQGYQNFKSFGCVACHQGVNVGGNMFQTMGVMGDYFKDRDKPITDADLGRYSFTHQEGDKFVFRVPSLRNVELTAPYFHDGSAVHLEDAVFKMGKYQLGKILSPAEIDSIVSFLKTLTGEQPASLRNSPNNKEMK